MKSILCILALSFCFTHNLAAQNKKLDSLILLYNKQADDTTKIYLGNLICRDLLYTNPKQALTYANELWSISKKIKYNKGKVISSYWLSSCFYNNQELDSAIFYGQKALKVSSEIDYLKGITDANTRLSSIYIRKNDYQKAEEYLNKNIWLYTKKDSIPNAKEIDFKYIGVTYQNLSEIHTNKGEYKLAMQDALAALHHYKRVNEELYIADAQNTLGIIESNLGNHEKSIEFYKPALETYRRFGDVVYESYVLNNIGKAYIDLEKPENAIPYFKQSLKIARDNELKGREGNYLTQLAYGYFKVGLIEDAIQSFNQSLDLYGEVGDPTFLNVTYIALGEVYYEIDNPVKAISYLDKAITISDSINAYKDGSRAYYFRSKSFKKLQNYNLALRDFEIHKIRSDSIFNSSKSRQIEEMRTIFDLETKEQQIALQEKEITVLEQKAEISALQKVLLGALLVLSLIGFYGIRQKLKRNKLEKEKVDAELAFKKKELTTHALHLAKKNEVLESVKQKAKELKLSEQSPGYSQLIKTINFDQQDDKNWENFTQYFEQVHKNFASNARAKYPDVTKNELRFMALIKMNMSSKEIATILNISTDGIKKVRQRLRKKMNLNPKDSLENIILDL